MEEELTEGRRRSGAAWLGAQLLALLAAGAALGFLWYKLQEERASAALGQKAAAQLSESLGQAEATAAELKAKLAAAEDDAAAARAKVEELSTEVREKDTELQRLKGTYAALEEKLKAEIKKGEIHLTQIGGRIQVDLVEKILFDSGRAELTNRGKDVLSRVGSILAGIGDRQIQVSGHTDDSPIAEPLRATFATNWELSTARAVNVVRFLEESAKVPGKRLLATGYGQFQPIADNADGVGRARNRRIEILLTPALAGKPAPIPAATARPDAKAAPVKAEAKAAPAKADARAPVKAAAKQPLKKK